MASRSTAIVIEDYSNGNDMIIGKPGVSSLKDLKGKKVGVEFGLVEHLLLLKGLEAAGMADTDVEIVKVSTNDTRRRWRRRESMRLGRGTRSRARLKQVAGSKPLFTSKEVPGLIYDGCTVSKESLANHREEWKKVVGVWFKTVDFINNPATHEEAVKIMAAKVSVNPKAYEKSLGGTALQDLAGNLSHYKKGDGLDSIYGCIKIANAFYLKTGV